MSLLQIAANSLRIGNYVLSHYYCYDYFCNHFCYHFGYFCYHFCYHFCYVYHDSDIIFCCHNDCCQNLTMTLILPNFRSSKGADLADIILAGDVLVYLGNLDKLFETVKKNLKSSNKGGKFIFSIEKLLVYSSSGYILHENARFAHSKRYIDSTAEKFGLNILSCSEVPLRYDGGNPVNGYVFVLQSNV